MTHFETVAQFGLDLGCLVCPSESSLKQYGGWGCLLHEIGHFAVAPPFLWDIPAHIDAVAKDERPPVPAVDAFAVGIDHDGGFHTRVSLWSEGKRHPFIAAIAENPNPLTDWHVRAWEVWAADRLGLPTPGGLWLQTTPWADLLYVAKNRDLWPGNFPGWADRHPEQVDRWEQRSSSRFNPEQELRWRLEDLFHNKQVDELGRLNKCGTTK